MDGRLFTVVFLLLLPAVLIGVTVVRFASNPLAIFVLLAMMVAGAFYLLSYTATFAAADAPS
ncbi:MAG: hypothetical protein L3K10_05680 [Thermoplasmata archaeon]|nr:hypothetical protein [Thermoplasmata archaeon]